MPDILSSVEPEILALSMHSTLAIVAPVFVSILKPLNSKALLQIIRKTPIVNAGLALMVSVSLLLALGPVSFVVGLLNAIPVISLAVPHIFKPLALID